MAARLAGTRAVQGSGALKVKPKTSSATQVARRTTRDNAMVLPAVARAKKVACGESWKRAATHSLAPSKRTSRASARRLLR
eukprot:7930185-Lingulodinium_polyedra.AAC.1